MGDWVKHRNQMIKKYEEQSGKYHGDRMTGRTTSEALGYISRAMRYPEETFYVAASVNSRQVCENLFRYIVQRIEEMKLDGFTLDRRKMTIKYSLKE